MSEDVSDLQARLATAYHRRKQLEDSETETLRQLRETRGELRQARAEVEALLGETIDPRPMPLFDGPDGSEIHPDLKSLETIHRAASRITREDLIPVPPGQPPGTVGHPAGARTLPEDAYGLTPHVHTRECYDDPGPGRGRVGLICERPTLTATPENAVIETDLESVLAAESAADAEDLRYPATTADTAATPRRRTKAREKADAEETAKRRRGQAALKKSMRQQDAAAIRRVERKPAEWESHTDAWKRRNAERDQ